MFRKWRVWLCLIVAVGQWHLDVATAAPTWTVVAPTTCTSYTWVTNIAANGMANDANGITFQLKFVLPNGSALQTVDGTANAWSWGATLVRPLDGSGNPIHWPVANCNYVDANLIELVPSAGTVTPASPAKITIIN